MPVAALNSTQRRAEVRALSAERYSLRVTLSAEAHGKLRRAQDLLRHVVPDGDPAAVVDRALTLLVEHLERRKFAAKKKAERVTRGPAHVRKGVGAGPRAAAAPVAVDGLRRDRAEAPGVQTVGVSYDEGTDRPEAPCALTGQSGSEVPPFGRHDNGPRRVDRRSSRHIPAAVKRAVWARDGGRCTFAGVGGRCGETGRLEFHHRVPVADGGEATEQNLQLRCTAHHAYESRRWFGEDWEAHRTIPCETGAVGSGTRPGPS